MAYYHEYILALDRIGFFNVILPLIIFYVLIYSAISRVKIIQKDEFKKLLSLALTMFIVLPFAIRPTGPILVAMQALQPFAAFLISALIVWIVIQFLGGDFKATSWTGFIIVLFIASAFVAYFVDKYNLQLYNPIFAFFHRMFSVKIFEFFKTDAGVSILALIFVFVLFVLVMYGPSKMWEDLRKGTKYVKAAAEDVKSTFTSEESKGGSGKTP